MAGRKAHTPTDEGYALARQMSGAGSTRREIAAAIGISVPTLAKFYAGYLKWPTCATAPLLDQIDALQSGRPRRAPRRVSGRSGGRPEFAPTFDQRRDVALMLADGWRHADIATALDISVPTLNKYFSAEIARGAIAARLENLRRLRAAASSGNVSAMRALQERFDTVEAVHNPPPLDVQKPKEDTPGKKVLATRAAQDAAVNGPWAELLRQRAN